MKFTRQQIIPGVVLLIIAGGIFLVLYLTRADRGLYLTTGWILVVLGLIFLTNRLLTRALDKRLPWLEYGNKRYYWQLAIGVLLSLIIINISYLIFKFGLTQDPPDNAQVISMNALGILILLPTISINFGIQFLKNWKNAQLDSEKFQKETVKAELNALKNHLDPHFLFNNLNILSALIGKDQKLSQVYLEKFAEVYRMILQSSSEEMVVLKQELDFVSAYMYLLQIRFEDTIRLITAIEEKDQSLYLPPLTLQMLIENAIKHNVITEARPLRITIESRNSYLVIKNNLQEKKVESGARHKSGLNNIKRRYSYFTDQPIEVIQDEKAFMVKVPLLAMSTV